MKRILTINGKPFSQWELIALDVWGNARDGFNLNNLHRTGEFICLPVELTDRDIVLALKRMGAIKRNVRHTSIRIDDAGEDILCIEDARTGEPVYQLWASTETDTDTDNAGDAS